MNDEEIACKRKRRVRTHGLKYPLHPLQIFSWAFYIADISAYYLIIMISIKHNVAVCIAITVLFTIKFLILAILDISWMLVNPTDRVMKQR